MADKENDCLNYGDELFDRQRAISSHSNRDQQARAGFSDIADDEDDDELEDSGGLLYRQKQRRRHVPEKAAVAFNEDQRHVLLEEKRRQVALLEEQVRQREEQRRAYDREVAVERGYPASSVPHRSSEYSGLYERDDRRAEPPAPASVLDRRAQKPINIISSPVNEKRRLSSQASSPGNFMRALAEMNGPSLEEREAARRRQQHLVEDLERQIQEKKERKANELARERELQKKEEREAMQYNPWGRPGAGAPNIQQLENNISRNEPQPTSINRRGADGGNQKRQQPPEIKVSPRRQVDGGGGRRARQQSSGDNRENFGTQLGAGQTYGRDQAPLPEGGVMVAVPKQRPPKIVDPYEAEVQQALKNQQRRAMVASQGDSDAPSRPSVYELRNKHDVDALAQFCEQLQRENEMMKQRLERQEKAFVALAVRSKGGSGSADGAQETLLAADNTTFIHPIDRAHVPAVTGGFVLRTPPPRGMKALLHLLRSVRSLPVIDRATSWTGRK